MLTQQNSFQKTFIRKQYLNFIYPANTERPGRQVISNCVTHTQRWFQNTESIFWNLSCKKSDPILRILGIFFEESKTFTTNFRRRYPCYSRRETSELPIEDIVQVTEFVLKNKNFLSKKMFFLSSMWRLKDKNQVQQVVPNLHLLTLVFSWLK